MADDHFKNLKAHQAPGVATVLVAQPPTHPATRAFAISKSDTVDCAEVTRAVYIGGDGDIAVIMADGGSPVTFVGLTAGTLLPIRISRLMSTNTDATYVVGLA